MAKIKVDIEEILNHPRLTIKTVPWSDKPFISRLAFAKGQVPKPLENYLIKKGECKGKTGFVVYNGRRIPATAACVAERRKKRAQA